MADNEKQIYIDVQAKVDEANSKLLALVEAMKNAQANVKMLNDAFKENQKVQADLGKQYQDGKITQQEYSEGLSRLLKEEKEINKEWIVESQQMKNAQSEYNKTIKQINQLETATKNTLEGKRNLLSLMKEEIKTLDVDSDEYKQLSEKILNLNNEVKDLEGSYGDFQRNVGNYKSAVSGLKESFLQGAKASGTLKGGLSAVSVSAKALFKTLIANPWTAILTAAAAILVKIVSMIKEAITSNDDAGTAFQRLWAVMKAPLELIQKFLNYVIDAIVPIINFLVEVQKKIQSIVPFLREQSELQDNIVVMTDDLEEKERQYALNSKKREREISELREKASEKEKYNFKERLNFLYQAKQVEDEQLRDERRIVDEKIKLFELEHKNQKKWNDAQKKEYNDLLIMREEANKKYYDSLRTLNKQINAQTNEAKQYWDDVNVPLNEAVKNINDYYTTLLKQTRKQTNQVISEQVDELRKLYSNGGKNKNLNDNYFYGLLNEIKDELLNYGDFKNVIKKLVDITLNSSDENIVNLANETLGSIREFIDTTNELRKQEEKNIEDARQVRAKKYMEELKKRTEDEGKMLKDLLLQNQKIYEELMGEGYQAEYNIIRSNYDRQRKELEEKYKGNNKLIKEALDEQIRLITLKEEEELKQLKEKYKPVLIKEIQDIINDLQEAFNEKDNTIKLKLDYDVSELQQAIDEAYNIAKEKGELPNMFENMMQNLKFFFSEEFPEANQKTEEEVLRSTQTFEGFFQTTGEQAKVAFDGLQRLNEELGNTNAANNLAIGLAVANAIATIPQIIGEAILGATKAASAGGPAAPFLLAGYIASAIGGIGSGIAQIVAAVNQTKEAKRDAYSQRYAEGGYVSGPGTGTSDSISARLSNGEFVVNAEATRRNLPLLQAINGNMFNVGNRYANGGFVADYSWLYDAISNITPIVSVKEITKVQNKIKIKERL